MNESYNEISPTALITTYFRTFTDISYEQEIFNYLEQNPKIKIPEELKEVLKKCNYTITTTELRHKLISKILESSNIKQVYELAAGFSSRGLIYSQKGYNYIEIDLEYVSHLKNNCLKSLNIELPSNLNVISGNVINKDEFQQCEQYLDNHEVAIINEGLLGYLSHEEKKIVAKNIKNLLKKYGGIWIANDLSYESIPTNYLNACQSELISLAGLMNNITSRVQKHVKFNSLEEIKEFYDQIGLEVIEVHKLSEVKDELSYITSSNVIEKMLDYSTVLVFKLKEN